jgi:pyridoxamine 5'-phosphate oxidase
MDLNEVRAQLMRDGLDASEAGTDPLRLFQRWSQEAQAWDLPLAGWATLATVREDGGPTARAVIVREVDARGFVFYSNYESRKGRELAALPLACLLFVWTPVERQVRIEGSVERISDRESDAFYSGRPLGARLEVWASHQSRPVADRSILEAALAHAHERYGEQPSRPLHWGGYRVVPESYEFWQGREDRIHDRLVYRRSGAGWALTRLSP